jgi:DNA-binding CsgD family transcriptional regulator
MEQMPVLHITPREKRLLQLLAKGKTWPELAGCLSISTTEVNLALTELYATIGATNRAQAIAIAQQRGLLEMSEVEPHLVNRALPMT